MSKIIFMFLFPDKIDIASFDYHNGRDYLSKIPFYDQSNNPYKKTLVFKQFGSDELNPTLLKFFYV